MRSPVTPIELSEIKKIATFKISLTEGVTVGCNFFAYVSLSPL